VAASDVYYALRILADASAGFDRSRSRYVGLTAATDPPVRIAVITH